MTEVMEEATEEEWDLEDQLWEVGIMAAAVVLEEDLVDGVDMEDEEGLGEGVDMTLFPVNLAKADDRQILRGMHATCGPQAETSCRLRVENRSISFFGDHWMQKKPAFDTLCVVETITSIAALRQSVIITEGYTPQTSPAQAHRSDMITIAPVGENALQD
uniref:Uncharacterized protein n=1 Tax=Talaromyces marneffei PM1 TaxID=1077442 RepID=A0A093UWK0_TALMA